MNKRKKALLDTENQNDSEPKSESKRLEFDLWAQEYQIVHNHIRGSIEADEKNYEFMIITFSAMIAATSVVISYKAYFLLLVLSIPFHILVWDQVKKSFTRHRLAKYVSEVVAPHLNAAIHSGVSSASTASRFLGWESYSPKIKYKWLVRIARLLPKFGRTSLEFGVSILLVVIYFLFKNQDVQYIPTSFDIILIVLNALLVAISLTALSVGTLQSKLVSD